MSARYEISEGELDVLAITGPEGTRYIDGEEIEARVIRQQSADIAELRAELAAVVAEIREVVVTDEMCWRVFANVSDECTSKEIARNWLAAWQQELGPALGLVELKEPTPEECERIEEEYARNERRVYTRRGRDMADAVRAVMFPQKSEVG